MQILLDPKKHVSPLGFFIKTCKSEFGWVVLNVIFYGLGAASMLAALYALGRVVDVITGSSNGNAPHLMILALVLIMFYEIFYRSGHIFEVISLSHIRRNIKKTLFKHTSSLSFGYFTDRFAGEIAHKVVTTADGFERIVLVFTNDFIEGGIVVTIAMVTLSSINYAYGLFILVWSFVYIAGIYPIAQKMNKLANDYAAAEAGTTGKIVDFYGNVSAVKVYGKSTDYQKAEHQIDLETRAFQRLGKWDVILFNFEGISIITLSAALAVITAILYKHSAISIGSIVFVLAAGIRIFYVLWDIGKRSADFIKFRGEVAQNLNDLVLAPSIIDGEYAGRRNERVSVEYRDVVFGYSDQKPVLDNFSLSVRSGEKVGIVGLSGAGKTTFANLLLRFFDPQSGEILLNDVDIKNFTQEFLRSHISYISQDTSLFHATISENIAYGSEAASQTDIELAAKLAYADDFIIALPKGYSSIVGERGIKLSGGQRQRIAIARALLADRPLFLLDEATSALDSDSEDKIQKGLAKLIENKTVIAIAHRLSTLAHMNRIIFIEDGRIIEDGTHKQLLAKNGKYAKLWEMQAGGFLPDEI